MSASARPETFNPQVNLSREEALPHVNKSRDDIKIVMGSIEEMERQIQDEQMEEDKVEHKD